MTKLKGKKMRKIWPCLSRVKNYHQMAITCMASSEHPEMSQVVLLLKMPCNSTSWIGTQVANHLWPLALAKSWTGSLVLRTTPLILNEQSNILTSTGKPTNSKADQVRWSNCQYHSTAGQLLLVSQPRQQLVPPGSAHQKVKWIV